MPVNISNIYPITFQRRMQTAYLYTRVFFSPNQLVLVAYNIMQITLKIYMYMYCSYQILFFENQKLIDCSVRKKKPSIHVLVRPRKKSLVTVARPTLFLCANSRFFQWIVEKKRNLIVKKSSKSVKLLKSYDFAVYTIELGQILLINPIRTMLIQLNWLSLPRPFQGKHPYALPLTLPI